MQEPTGMAARVVRIALVALVLFVMTVAVAAGGAALWLRSEAGNRYLRQQIVERINQSIEGAVHVEGLRGSLWSGVRFDGVRLLDAEGRLVARSASVTLRYRLWHLLFAHRVDAVRRVDLDRPEVRVFTRADGRNNLAALPRPAVAGASPTHIDLRRVHVHEGRIIWQGRGGGTGGNGPALSHLVAQGEVHLGEGSRIVVREATAEATLGGRQQRVAVRGTLDVGKDGALRLHRTELQAGGSRAVLSGELGPTRAARPRPRSLTIALDEASLAPAEVTALLPSLRPSRDVVFRGRAQGTTAQLGVELEADLPRGRATARSAVALPSSGRALLRLTGTRVALDEVDVGELARDIPLVVSSEIELVGELVPGGLSAQAKIANGHGHFRQLPFGNVTGNVRLVARRAVIERMTLDVPGAHVTGGGEATLDGAARLRLDVRILDLRRLPDMGGLLDRIAGLVASPLVRQVPLRVAINKDRGQAARVTVSLPGPVGAATGQARRILEFAPRELPGMLKGLPGIRNLPLP